MKKGRILVTGALGQLGSELKTALTDIYGEGNIIFSDVRHPRSGDFKGNFILLDVLNKKQLANTIKEYKISQIYHLAAMLSAKAEKDMSTAWDLNIGGLLNVLEVCRELSMDMIFWPSSIAVFGPDTPKKDTPQQTVMNPNTVYGISKLTGEMWCRYYNEHFNMDIRCLRYPGLIGYKALPGGGTTDYALDIFHQAVKGGNYECYIQRDNSLPMMYMPDAVRATLELMNVEKNTLTVTSGYNVSGLSFTPEDLYREIKRYYPGFKINYVPDYRNEIAKSWPDSIDDTQAQKDWGWKPTYNLASMTEDMLANIKVSVAV